MKRREQRKLALQVLFSLEFNPMETQEAIQIVLDEFSPTGKSEEYLSELVSGVQKNKEKLDQLLAPYAEDWSLERIYDVDRILCRMALFEMYRENEPLSAGIAINEIVELAKEFGEDESPRFINGILGAVVKGNEKVSFRD